MNSFVILVLLLSCCTFLGETGKMYYPGDPILSQQSSKVKTEGRSEIVNKNKKHTGSRGGRMIYPNDPDYIAYLEEKTKNAKPINSRFAKMIKQEVTDHVNLSIETTTEIKKNEIGSVIDEKNVVDVDSRITINVRCAVGMVYSRGRCRITNKQNNNV